MKIASLALFLTFIEILKVQAQQDIPDDFNLREVTIGSKFVFRHYNSPCTITSPNFFDVKDEECFEGDNNLGRETRSFDANVASNRYVFDLDQSKKNILWILDGSNIIIQPAICTLTSLYNANKLSIIGITPLNASFFSFQDDGKCPYLSFSVTGFFVKYPDYPKLRDDFGITIYLP